MTSQVGVAPVVQPQVQTSRSYGRLIMFGILILASVLYGPALRGLPIWEDNQLIRAAGTDSLRECFTRPFLDAYFRPLVSLSFLVDHHFWAGEPFMYHQTNILLHVLTTAVWISALQAAFRNWWIAPVGGLMFAVQPAQVSTVAWIGGRTDSLCALWVALFVWTLILATRSTGRKRVLLLSLSTVSYALALLTKEQTLLLLPLIPMAFRCFSPADQLGQQRVAWRETVPFAIACVGFLALWLAIGPKLLSSAPHDLGYKIELFGRTLTFYALLLLLPTPQAMHSVTVISLERAGFWSVLSGFALLVMALALIRRWLRSEPASAWFLALVVLSLLPVSNLMPLGSLIVAPFRAGVAGLGVAALLAWAIVGGARSAAGQHGKVAQTWRWAVGGVFTAWCCGLTAWGAMQWSDQPAIFATMARYDPGSMYVREGIIGSLMEAKQPAQARNHAESLLTWLFGSRAWQEPASAVREFWQNPQVVARIHSSNGDKRTPQRAVADLLTSLAYGRLGIEDRAGALIAFQTGSALDPDNPSVNLGLGRWYYAAHDWTQASRYLKQSIAVNPRVPTSHVLLASCYEQQGQWQAACAEYDAALDLQPWDGAGYVALAKAQMKSGNWAAGRATLEAGLRHAETNLAEIRLKLASLPPRTGDRP